jgi:hypothetical protein
VAALLHRRHSMLTLLLGVLTAVPVLGEAGESCRNNADCIPSLTCQASTCSERVAEPPPVPHRPWAPPPEQVLAADEPNALFSGVHFFLGAMVGAGPAWVKTSTWANERSVSFSAVVPQIPVELRLGLLIGRFELAAEAAPASTFFFNGTVRQQTSAALCVGALIKLLERENLNLSLPLRARSGVILGETGDPGGLLGASVGLAFRFGNTLVEGRLFAFEYRWRGPASVTSLPFSFSVTTLF